MPRTPLLALICSTLAAHSSSCAAQAPDRATAAGELPLLASVVIADRSVDAQRPVELSALAFDRDQRVLYAASDRGVLFRLALQWQGGHLLGATAAAAWPLRHPVDGSALDIEGLAWRPGWPEGDAELIVAPEFGATAFRLDVATRSIATLPWPRGAVPARERSAASRQGVEALDWHPSHGSIAVMQRAASAGPKQHEAHARDGSHWRWPALAEGADIKAIEVVSPQRALVLERVRVRGQGRGDFYLRSIDLTQCVATASLPCAPVTWRVPLPQPGEGSYNLEGLACLSETECLLVSDSGESSRRPTLLLHVRVP
jgi:Esterase-like activity of phytase